MTRPFSPFHTVLNVWKCSTNRPVAVTFAPLTMTPFVPMLVCHRSVSPFTPVGEPLDAVVSAPHPGVVDQHVVGVDLERGGRLSGVRATDAEVHVAQRDRVARVELLSAVRLSDLHQRGRELRSSVDGDAGDDDTRGILHLHGDRATGGGEGRLPHTQHHSVRTLDINRAVDVVDARGEDQVLATRERVVDVFHVVARLRDEEVGDRDAAPSSLALAPRRAARVRVS